jgi:D-serine deaminase-like pyridoxal phosphate-dependent protein
MSTTLPFEAPPTPYLKVDPVRMRHNIRRASERAASARVALRPHIKTHKCVEVAKLQLAAGAVGITVATLVEAETFARHEFDDIFIAYPLWLDKVSARRMCDLVEMATLTIGVDSPEGAAAAGKHLGNRVRALVEVDSGHHRSGVQPQEAGTLARTAARAGLDVRGVFTFPGHSYAPDQTGQAAVDEAEALAEAAESLRTAGIEPTVVSGGSTPSLAGADTDVLTELRPGVYVFGDAQQWELGSMSPDDVALTCCSTVVSHAGGRLVLDAGSKALGADRASWATGYGRLLEHPEARIVLLSEHHAVADLGGAPLPAIGSRVDVVPNHVCNAVNLAGALHIDDAGVLMMWPVVARGQNG